MPPALHRDNGLAVATRQPFSLKQFTEAFPLRMVGRDHCRT
jgi:hypothetical protein